MVKNYIAVFLFNSAPTLVSVDVRNGEESDGGSIRIGMEPLAKATS